jgi:hypothetical protein
LPPSTTSSGADAIPPVLAGLLAGRTDGLPALRALPVACHDQALDATQSAAVAAALQTPDICLIQGLPGTGKSRVVAEIIRQAVARGDRVLFLSPWPAALDAVLLSLVGQDGLLPLRHLGASETLDALPTPVRPFTFAERERVWREQIVPEARRKATVAEQQVKALTRREPAWHQLSDLIRREQELSLQAETLLRLRSEVPAAVTQECEASVNGVDSPPSSAFLARAVELRSRFRELDELDRRIAALEEQIDQSQAACKDLDNRLSPLQPLAEAKKSHRWWTLTWWRAGKSAALLDQVKALETESQNARDSLTQATEALERLIPQREQEHATLHSARRQLLEDETARRLGDLDDQEAALRQERGLLHEKWLASWREWSPPPVAKTEETLGAVRAQWQEQVKDEQQRLDFVRRWADYLEKDVDGLVPRLAHAANLVAAPLSSFPTCLSSGTPSFDLLVLEGAHEVAEPEFLRAASLARRWVLVGEPTVAAADSETSRRKPSAGGALASQPGLFQPLWQSLHADPRRLPYRWLREGDRLCCRLRFTPPEQRHWLESEHVANNSEIELRILSLPRREPVLAEVVFPAALGIARAKEYIFRELEELPVQAAGGCLKWVEQEDRVLLYLDKGPHTETDRVSLVPGVTEVVGVEPSALGAEGEGPSPFRTCRLEFERAAGWQREKAEAWLLQRLGLRDTERTFSLETPYRMHPPLAAFLSHLLFEGGYRLSGEANGTPAAVDNEFDACAPVQFVAVPPQEQETTAARTIPGARGLLRETQGGATTTLTRMPRTAAGRELDLADPRQRQQLPAELATCLPAQGLVNYEEAVAVVQVLEALVNDPGLNRDALVPPSAAPLSTIGVVALYAAQAELIRRLIEQAPSLVASPWSLVVDVPAAFREKECLVLLVSLTRSHAQRAASLGEGPQLLALALTRARRQLVLLGDPGTLVRRSQWDGPVDSLDEAATARERAISLQLVHYLNGQGPLPRTFHLRQGSWT